MAVDTELEIGSNGGVLALIITIFYYIFLSGSSFILE